MTTGEVSDESDLYIMLPGIAGIDFLKRQLDSSEKLMSQREALWS